MPTRVMRTGCESEAAERGNAKLRLDLGLAVFAALLSIALEPAPASPSAAEQAGGDVSHLGSADSPSRHHWATGGALDVAAEAQEPQETLDERPGSAAAEVRCCSALFPAPLWSVVLEPTWVGGVPHRRGVVGLGRGPPLA